MFQNWSLGPSTSSKTPKLTAPPPPHGICFWLSNPQRFIVVFLDWCLSLIGKEIMQTFSPKIPWGRFSNLLWLTSVFTPALTSEQTLYFYNVPHLFSTVSAFRTLFCTMKASHLNLLLFWFQVRLQNMPQQENSSTGLCQNLDRFRCL